MFPSTCSDFFMSQFPLRQEVLVKNKLLPVHPDVPSPHNHVAIISFPQLLLIFRLSKFLPSPSSSTIFFFFYHSPFNRAQSCQSTLGSPAAAQQGDPGGRAWRPWWTGTEALLSASDHSAGGGSMETHCSKPFLFQEISWGTDVPF